MKGCPAALCALMTLAFSASPAGAFCAIIDASHTTFGSLTGGSRQMSVADEYVATKYVLTAKIVAQKLVGVDKEGLFKGTNYRVAPLQTYKGHPPGTFSIYSENSSARFPMDVGKSYLLFVYRLNGQFIVDSCGWSDEVGKSDFALARLKNRNELANQPSHCWKGSSPVCVPDLRTK